jgi:hypothetical protein
MRNTVGVQVLKDVDYFCDIEDLDFLGQFGNVKLDETDKLSSLAKLLYEI